jgi:hypothetical protein
MCDICKLDKSGTFIDLESYQDLEKENARLRDALEFYGNAFHQNIDDESFVLGKGEILGKRARQALKGSEE